MHAILLALAVVSQSNTSGEPTPAIAPAISSDSFSITQPGASPPLRQGTAEYEKAPFVPGAGFDAGGSRMLDIPSGQDANTLPQNLTGDAAVGSSRRIRGNDIGDNNFSGVESNATDNPTQPRAGQLNLNETTAAPAAQFSVGSSAAVQPSASFNRPDAGRIITPQIQPSTPSESLGAGIPSGVNLHAPDHPADNHVGTPRPAGGQLGAFQGTPSAHPKFVPPATVRPMNTQPEIARTSAEQPLPMNMDVSAAKRLLRRAILRSGPQPEQTPVSLDDALMSISDRKQQAKAVKAYWKLCLAEADLSFAQQELQWLKDMKSPASLYTRNWEAALLAAEARATEAALANVAAQHDFAAASGNNVLTAEFAPTDLPYVGLYRTRLQEMYAGRTPPVVMQRIDSTLPFYVQLIKVRGEAAEAAEEALLELANSYDRGQTGVWEVLQSHTAVTKQRLAFLRSVGDYNNTIADYAMAVARPGLPRESVVGMLIELAGRQPVFTGAVRQASAEQPYDSRWESTSR